MKTLLLTIFLFTISILSYGQAPGKINYQGVAQNEKGRILRNTDISLRFFIRQGSTTGSIKFSETHEATTSQSGAFSLQIGSKDPGTFEEIDWGADDHFLEIEIDENGGANSFVSLGTFEMLSVPYSFYSIESGGVRSVIFDGAEAGQILRWNESTSTWEPSDENVSTFGLQLDYEESSNTLSIEFNEELQSVDLSSLQDNTDEQALSLNDDTLSLTNGGFVVFTDLVEDDDSDSTNELQTLSLEENTLSLSEGGSVTLGDEDSTNEIQILSISNDTIYLSDGGFAVLPEGADDLGNHQATQNIDLNDNWLSNSDSNSGIRIDDSGQVGINDDTPEATMDINGNLAIRGTEVINSDGEYVGPIPVGSGIPSGMISMWYGTINNIPTGWALCDGTNGTPDLSGKFMVGYDPDDSDYDNLGDEGGEKEVTLTVDQLASHSHGNRVFTSSENSQSASGTYPAGRNFASSAFRGLRNTTTNRTNTNEIVATGGNQPHENRPPYFVIAYIMKL